MRGCWGLEVQRSQTKVAKREFQSESPQAKVIKYIISCLTFVARKHFVNIVCAYFRDA